MGQVSWFEPTATLQNGVLDGYDLSFHRSSETVWDDGTRVVDADFGSSDPFLDLDLPVSPLTFTVINLLPYITYTFRVRAYNEIKGNRTASPWSDEQQLRTLEV